MLYQGFEVSRVGLIFCRDTRRMTSLNSWKTPRSDREKKWGQGQFCEPGTDFTPSQWLEVSSLIRVQRRFTECLRGYSHYSYRERLHRLQLQSL